jgi:type II secretory ATPase GspE/PulE/Tfp pilus assembly ATPase PilB-like protein
MFEFKNIVEKSIRSAIKMGASDVFLNPRNGGYSIDIKSFGKIEKTHCFNRNTKNAFITAVLPFLNLKISEINRSHDAHKKFNQDFNLRSGLQPTKTGPHVAIRLVNTTKTWKLGEIGIQEEQKLKIQETLRSKSRGIIVISGPTGSGKSTTINALINEINNEFNENKKIFSIEDPVEYDLENVTQSEVNSFMSYEDHVRSLLRQNPDVIIIGEVRDQAVAKAAIRASMTGHLVITTLHANSAKKVLARLYDLGVSKNDLKENMIMSIFQEMRESSPSFEVEVYND